MTQCRNCKYSINRDLYAICDNINSPCYGEEHSNTPEECTVYEDSYDYRRDTLILGILSAAPPNPATALDLACLRSLIERGY